MNLSFPYNGVDKGHATINQPRDTSPNMKNVRLYENLGKRARGGQRPGLDKAYSQQIGGASAPIVAICSVSVVV
jgi:hypothetical protein